MTRAANHATTAFRVASVGNRSLGGTVSGHVGKGRVCPLVRVLPQHGFRSSCWCPFKVIKRNTPQKRQTHTLEAVCMWQHMASKGTRKPCRQGNLQCSAMLAVQCVVVLAVFLPIHDTPSPGNKTWVQPMSSHTKIHAGGERGGGPSPQAAETTNTFHTSRTTRECLWMPFEVSARLEVNMVCKN